MKTTTIFRQLIINITIIIVISLSLIVFFSALQFKKIIATSNDEMESVLTNEVINLLQLQDFALQPAELKLTEEMKKISKALVNKYFVNTNDIDRAQLLDIQKKLNTNYDIYIINTEGIIVNTTFSKDLGFNLFEIDDNHKEFLLSVLRDSSFIEEKISVEHMTGKIKKYTYQATTDHKYIIELGAYSEDCDAILAKFKDVINNIENNKFLDAKSIDLFIGIDNPMSFNRNAVIEPEQKDIYLKTFRTQSNQDTLVLFDDKVLQYKYIYITRQNTSLYKASVVRIVTDTTKTSSLFRKNLLIFGLIFLITPLIQLIVIYIRTRKIILPIKKLQVAMDLVKKGNLNVKAEVTGRNEISKFAHQFNLMLEQLRQFYQNLEAMVEERTKEINRQKQELENQAEKLKIYNDQLEELTIAVSKTPNAIAIYDSNLNLEWINDGFENMISDDDHVLGLYINMVNKIIFDHSDIKVTALYENILTRKDESDLWLQTSLTPLFDNHTGIKKYIVVSVDISLIKKAETEITLQKQRIEFHNNQLKKSINYALTIQRGILPLQKEIDVFFESFIIYRPKDIVSGDFYWMANIIPNSSSDEKVLFALVDCTGHGVPGGFMSMIGSQLLNDIVIEKKNFMPDKILEILQQNIIQELKQSENEGMDGMEISLCLFEKYSEELVRVTFSGSEMPVYYYNRSNSSLEEIKATDRTIGGISRKLTHEPFETHTIFMSADDSLYLMSDGFFDQPNFARKRIGKLNAKQIILTNVNLSLKEQQGAIEKAIEAHQGTELQRDDITIIGLKVKPDKFGKRIDISEYNWSEYTILIGDDIELNFNIIYSFLHPTNIKILWAKNGLEAVNICKTNRNISIVVIDIRMPEMDGITATRLIKENRPDLPVIILSSYSIEIIKRDGKEAGCDDYLTRPVKVDELVSTLSKYLFNNKQI